MIDRAAFRKHRRYAQTAGLGEVGAELHDLRALDLEAERAQWSYALGVGAWLGLAVVALAAAAHAGYPSWAFAVVGGCLLAGASCFVVAERATHMDVENRRYDLVERILTLLAIDLGPEAEVSIRLELEDPRGADKRVGDDADGDWRVERYEDPWLELRGRLLDETAFVLRIDALPEERSRQETTPQGETLTKRVWEEETRLVLELQPPLRRYDRLEAVARVAEAAVRLPEHARLEALSLEPEALRLEVRTRAAWTAAPPNEPDVSEAPGTELVAMMFLSLYHMLHLSERVTAGVAG